VSGETNIQTKRQDTGATFAISDCILLLMKTEISIAEILTVVVLHYT